MQQLKKKITTSDFLRKDKAAIRLNRAKIAANSRQNDSLPSKSAKFAVGQSAAGLAAMHAALAEEFEQISGHALYKNSLQQVAARGSKMIFDAICNRKPAV